jgi:small subunit ribosomal protein S20
MPNTESAKRALRKMKRRQERNRGQRSALKTIVKKVRGSAVAPAGAAPNIEAASTVLQTAIKKLDQAADKHLIHKNKAARLKSRLTRLINKQKAAAAPAAPAQ